MSDDALDLPADAMISLLLDHGSESLLLIDPASLRIAGFNRAATEMLGYGPRELHGMSILEIECAIQDLFFWDAVQSGSQDTARKVEGMHRHKDGTVIAIEKDINRVDCRGRDLILLCAREISDRKRIENLLAEKQSQLAATLEATADGIYVVDLYGHLMNFNSRFADIWQIPDELSMGNDGEAILEYMAAQTLDVAAYLDRLLEISSDPVSEAFDTIELADGRIFERSAKPMYVAGQPVGRVFSFSDVTQRKRAESELIVARDAAEKASKAKSEFLSQMSHELRTPLNAILGFAQILESDVTPDQNEIVQYITKAGWHLLRLIDEILDLARIEAGKFAINMSTISLPDMLDDCLALVQPLTQKHSITLHNQISPDVPLLCSDPLRLKQMLINLISNAIKYNRPNGSVTFSTEKRDSHLRIFVRDTGIGMTPEDVEQLFRPFTRVGDKQHNVEGTGIGLALTRELALLMHGDIGVDSVPGEGSTFWIDVMLAEEEQVQAEATPEAPAAASFSGPQRHVLYVEDDPVATILMRQVFKRLPNATLQTASDPYKGLDMALEGHFDLIMLDINLPGMNGLELARRLRDDERTRATLLFAFSANALASDVDAGMEAGFDRYLTKPLQIQALSEALREALNTAAAGSDAPASD